MKRTPRTSRALIAALIATPFAATSALSEKAPDASAMSTTPASVMVFDQKPSNATVDVKYAFLPAQGYLVVYGSDGNGAPTGKPLGSVALAAGDHRDVSIELSEKLKSGTTLWTSIYHDVDGDKAFDAAKDKPIWSSGLPPINAFNVL